MASRIQRIPLERIHPGPWQARSQADAGSIESLAASIERFGLLSPLLLRRCSAGEYELIAGFRRLQALKMLGQREAEAIVLIAYDGECSLLSLIENIQREALHFLDEARACRQLLDAQQLSQGELAAVLGRSPSALANRLRLLRLTEAVQAVIREGALSERHARALLQLADDEMQLETARLAVQRKWSVRRLEAQISRTLQPSPAARKAPQIRDKRLVVNAFRETLRRLEHIGIQFSSRVEEREDAYDIIVTVQKHR